MPMSMRRLFVLATLALASASVHGSGPALGAASLSNASELAAAAEQDTGAYALLESLTTEIGPRMAGSPA